MFLEVTIGLAEVATAEEAAVSRKGRGVRRGEDEVLVAVDLDAFFLGVFPPEEENEVFLVAREVLDDGVGEGFPAAMLVRPGRIGADGERGIQEEDALLCPVLQVARGRDAEAEVVADFFVDVLERGWGVDPFGDGERESVCLPGAVIRVLPEDDDAHPVERTEREGIEDELRRRVDGGASVFVAHEIRERLPRGLLEFTGQSCLPR